MPRITIIPADGMVGVDFIFRKVDLAGLDPDIHAVQWDGVNGHVEYRTKGKPPKRLSNIVPYQKYIDSWNAVLPPPAPPAPPTDDERIDGAIASDPLVRGLVNVLAENMGVAPAAVVVRIKELK